MDGQVAGRRTAPSGAAAAAANPNANKNSNDNGRKRPRQEQINHECIVELNPPRRERIVRAPRTFRVSSSESDVDAASLSAGEEQQCGSETDQGGNIPTSFSIPQKKDDDNVCMSNRSDKGQIIQSSVSQLPQQGQQPCQVYRGENMCPFCGYKCPDEEFPDGAVNHLQRFHSHQYHFTIEVLEPQQQSSPPTLLPTLAPAMMLEAESDSSSLSSAKVPSSIMPRGNRSTFVVTAEPLMLQKRLGVDRRSDFRCQRTYYYTKSKIQIQTGHHQRDEQGEALNEWHQQLREKMICDLEDAREDEKKFMTLWNKFWMSRPGKGERIVMTPAKVHAFIDQYASHLATLEWELMAHLIALWEHKLLSSQHIEDCMVYHQQVQNSQLKLSKQDQNGNSQKT